LELNCFGLAVLLLIFLNIRRHINRYLLDQKLFLSLIFTTAMILVLDMFMWLFDGMPGILVRIAYLIVTVSYYVLNPLICVLWYFYTDYYINRSKPHLGKVLLPMLAPVFVNLILSVLSTYGNVLFYIDGDNLYHRGRFFLVMPAISFFFLAYTMIYMICNRGKLQRREYVTLLVFPIPPIIGGIIQTRFYGVSLIWICTTISLLIIFINFQNDQLNTDHLTGLYNRRQLDDYLHAKSPSSGAKSIAGIMIDLDSFKAVNDTYGHNSGDQALKYFAEILKNTFRKSDFTARYGGDEFVVIMEVGGKADLEKAIGRLSENVDDFNARKLVPYEIGFSVGYDCYSSSEESSSDFLNHIDSLMYSNKQKTKNG